MDQLTEKTSRPVPGFPSGRMGHLTVGIHYYRRRGKLCLLNYEKTYSLSGQLYCDFGLRGGHTTGVTIMVGTFSSPFSTFEFPTLLRIRAALLYFRCLIRIHQCRAPVNGGTNLQRRDSGSTPQI